MSDTRLFYCRQCRLVLEQQQLESGWKHRIIIQNGPDEFHGVTPIPPSSSDYSTPLPARDPHAHTD